jgi:hypothetical protein
MGNKYDLQITEQRSTGANLTAPHRTMANLKRLHATQPCDTRRHRTLGMRSKHDLQITGLNPTPLDTG